MNIRDVNLDQLAMNFVVILKAHDMLNKLHRGEDIGDSEFALGVKEIYNNVGKGQTPLESIALQHAVMLFAQFKALGERHEYLSKVIPDKVDDFPNLFKMSYRLSEFDFDNEPSLSNMETELVKYLADLVDIAEVKQGV